MLRVTGRRLSSSSLSSWRSLSHSSSSAFFSGNPIDGFDSPSDGPTRSVISPRFHPFASTSVFLDQIRAYAGVVGTGLWRCYYLHCQ